MRRRQALLCLLSLLPACRRTHTPASPPAPLTSEAYVWQRRSSSQLTSALHHLTHPPTPLHFLRAEFSVRQQKDQLVQIPPLSTSPSGAVIRIHGTIAKNGWNRDRIDTIGRCIVQLAAEKPTEIQIDYDCPTSQLATYASHLRHWQSLAPHIPFAFTALPSWLHAKDFTTLRQSTPSWILQVHALHVPPSPDQDLEIFSTLAARKAVALASSFPSPFRIALPTYGGEACFNAQGKLLDVLSEDVNATPAHTAQRRFALADASAISTLVCEWLAQPPPHVTGLIWYRLPLASDRRNWSTTTWNRVRQGLPVAPDLALTTSPDPSGSTTVTLTNHGTAHATLPTVTIHHAVLGDALTSYLLKPHPTGLFLTPSPHHWPFLAPGESLPIAWFRPTQNTPTHVSFSTP